MINANRAIRIERQWRKSGGPRKVYIFICEHEDCSDEIKVRADSLRKATGFCQTHSHIKRPYESIYNGLFNDHRKTKVELTYEEYLEFVKIKLCHYCGDKIPWIPYAVVKGEYGSRAYFLDKKNPSGPYSLMNCVVCCTDCNRQRGNKFTYKEFLIIGSAIRQVKDARKSSQVA